MHSNRKHDDTTTSGPRDPWYYQTCSSNVQPRGRATAAPGPTGGGLVNETVLSQPPSDGVAGFCGATTDKVGCWCVGLSAVRVGEKWFEPQPACRCRCWACFSWSFSSAGESGAQRARRRRVRCGVGTMIVQARCPCSCSLSSCFAEHMIS